MRGKIDTTHGMRLVFTIGIPLFAFVCAFPSFALIHEELQTQILQYATDSTPTLFFNGSTQIETSRFQTKIYTYGETGTKGSWSLDPDPLRFDFHFSETQKSLMWLGREQPLNLVRSEKVEATDAVGTVWTQNQLYALQPRVSGWMSIGLHQPISTQTTLIVAYSPLFIPTLGPSLGFSQEGDIHPQRYSRLPPSTVNTGGVNLPIQYQLDLGQIRDLVLQPQFFAGIAHHSSIISMDASFFSAPRPNAVPLTSAKLAVKPNAVTAKVEIEPQFPSEQWTAFRMQFKNLSFKPSIEWVQGLHDWSQQYVSFSGTSSGPHPIRFGFLSHLNSVSDEPRFSDALAFVRIPWRISDPLEWRNGLQTTLLSSRQSMYWLSELEYFFRNGFSILATTRLLAGDNYSWFGDWRAEDSAGIGMRWIW
jgi:hypothetical protein